MIMFTGQPAFKANSAEIFEYFAEILEIINPCRFL